MATSQNGLFLNQRKYVLDLLNDADMMDCKPTRTTLDSKLQLDMQSEAPTNLTDYEKLVGKLIYLTITRPDISYAVSIASQFMHAPTIAHLHVKRILCYLKGSFGRGILMKKNGNTAIMGYTNADWAGNSLDCKSTTGFCTFVGGNLVTRRSKKQSVIARSSAEAKYQAMASTFFTRGLNISRLIVITLEHKFNRSSLIQLKGEYWKKQEASKLGGPTAANQSSHIFCSM
ncbi:uncharacterized mitochondrial protein AtMg00810-like [Pyrus communis]|uniref:uncharacterized mitochondrial protein AtMg00810-like n=1 Tax=Pyrus communis TaxID=23211 RepID=UPI0035C05E98